MTDALTASQRSKLERLISRSRALLENDLATQAAGTFGIDPDGAIAAEATLRLDPSGLADRREIVEVVEHLKSEGESAPDAVARLLREAVFTHLNRLVAIRIAEALGLLPPSLARRRPITGIPRRPRVGAPARRRRHERVLDLPTGVRRRTRRRCPQPVRPPKPPARTRTKSPRPRRAFVDLFADPASNDLWAASDCLGWTYQFFNTGEERRAMREASPAPRNSRELAVRNQFFTPRYVVDFLIQNSLGRRLLDADPTSPLIDDLPLLVDPPTKQGQPVELDKVSCP